MKIRSSILSRLFLAIILVVIIRMPHLTAVARLNTAARQVAIDCSQPTISSSHWLQATHARCLGAHTAARAHFTAVIQQSSVRLPVIRAAYPHDAQLALTAIENHPTNADAHFWLAESHRAAGDDAAAIAAYQQGLQYAPLLGEYWLWLGRLQQEQSHTDEALTAYLNACNYGDPGKHGCRDAAAIYYQRADFAAAAQYYERSIQQVSGHARTRRQLAESYLALDNAAAAQPHLQWLAGRGDEWATEQLQNLR